MDQQLLLDNNIQKEIQLTEDEIVLLLAALKSKKVKRNSIYYCKGI